MKRNQLVLSLALALMAMLATTGCRHGLNGKTTTLYGHRNPVADNANLPPTQPGLPIDTTPQPVVTPGPGQTPTTDTFKKEDYNPDRGALAADTVHFKFDSTVVQDKDQASIANVAQFLANNPNDRLLIEGHCDERGTEEYNRSLGERRALALREALQKNNVDAMHVMTESFGKDKPLEPGHNEAAWSKNRRGEFVVLVPKNPVQ